MKRLILIYSTYFFEIQLLLLVVFAATALFWSEKYSSKSKQTKSNASADERLEAGRTNSEGTVSALKRKYLVAYAIVAAADWFQGPYLYSLFREQYMLSERFIAILYVTAFVSKSTTAPFVAIYGDRFGRRKLCLVSCITYAFSCLWITIPPAQTLLFSRILSGISTSVLLSTFESWMTSSAKEASLEAEDISSIMSRATLISGFAATAAGITSNQLVWATGNLATPFVASGILSVLAWIFISRGWSESSGGPQEHSSLHLGHAWAIARQKPHLLVLGMTQVCFEASTFLFISTWVPSLQERQWQAFPLPFGYIFASFMVCMTIGSLAYAAIVAYSHRTSGLMTEDTKITLNAKISGSVFAVSALMFAVAATSPYQHSRFRAFCVFEMCIGIYYLAQHALTSSLNPKTHVAALSTLFRLPLNLLVVVLVMNGTSDTRNIMLAVSAVMLAISSLMIGAFIVDCAEEGNAT